MGRSEEQNRFRQVLREAHNRHGTEPDEGHVMLVRGYGGIGKSTLLRRLLDIARGVDHEPPVGRFTVLHVDWEQDRELHGEDYVDFAGPPIWRILERIRAAVEETSRSWGWRQRRRLQGFAEFQRHVTRLPELEERATDLGIRKEVGHRPTSPERLVKAVKTAGQIAGATGHVTATIGAAASAVVQVGSAVVQARSNRLDPAAYRALVDQVDALVEAFSAGLRALARKQPLVIVLDTCELLGESGPWLREVMRRSGRRVVWLVGVRLEPELLAAGDSEALSYEREVDERRLRSLTLNRFDDRTALRYLQQQLHQIPRNLDVNRVIELTQGVPLALYFMVQLINERLRTIRHFDDLYEEIGGDGTVSSVVSQMADRYLKHANRNNSSLRHDLPLLYGLALMNIDHSTGAARTLPVPAGRDPALLAAVWNTSPGQVAEQLWALSHRHDFVHSREGTLHRDVRDAIRLFLLNPARRASDSVSEINSRAVEHLRKRLDAFACSTRQDQLTDAAWRSVNVALLWHTFWLEPAEGVRMLCDVLPAAAVLQRDYAQLLMDIGHFFLSCCAESEQALIRGLEDLAANGAYDFNRQHPSEPARAAMRKLEEARPAPGAGDTAYLDILSAQAWHALGLDMADRVHRLRHAAKLVKPGSGPTADRIGHLASALFLPDVKSQPISAQKALIAGLRLAARYDRSAMAYKFLGSMLNELGRFEEAETALRQALRCDPDYATAHNNLGYTLYQLSRFEEAETALRQALRCDPDYATAHNNLGTTLYELRRFEGAEAALREALRCDPDYASAHASLGATLLQLGRPGEARSAMQEALRLDPGQGPLTGVPGDVEPDSTRAITVKPSTGIGLVVRN